MSAANCDRNLLIGILALQLDFIDRDELVAAMNAWVINKERTLDRILVDQGELRGDTHALLTALVEKHLELHDRDAHKSLAALSSIGSLREDLNSIGDRQVELTLQHVSIGREPNGGGDTTQSFTVGTSTSGGQRFRVLRPHAKGGLGQISVALDSELKREVALKEIQDPFADDPNSRARFVLEAEITGGLEHPGIVPVYGLGQYADGRPYYAMRFVRGDSLKEAVDRFHKSNKPKRDPAEQSLELRNLLGRFVDVCNAVEYAHSRGVLHRDLKPGNVMLGKFGETLVVDWGLAKPVGREEREKALSDEATLSPNAGSGSAPTQMGSAIGTPAFMSPEQAAGRLDELGPRSDVYSLGAMLYYVLVGKVAFADDDLGTTLRKVQTGDFPKPRDVDPGISRALEAICLKAMTVKPNDRYATPRAIADEVERWLADEPVHVLPDTLPKQLWRYLRRRPGGLGVALIICGMMLAMDKFFEAQRWEHIFVHQRTEYQRRLSPDLAATVDDIHGLGFHGITAARNVAWIGIAVALAGLAIYVTAIWRVRSTLIVHSQNR